MRGYVLAVDAVAIAVVAATSTSVAVTGLDAARFAALAVGAAIHIELSRGVERVRLVLAEGRDYIDTKSIWNFAGLLVLPPELVWALLILTFTHSGLRVPRRTVPHRWVFSAATVVLGTGAAMAILAATGTHPGIPAGPVGLAAVVGAAAARMIVNHALVIGAIKLATPGTPLRQVLANAGDLLVDAAALGIGTAAAAMLVWRPALLPVLMVPILALNRSLLLHHFQRAAHTDSKTRLANAAYFYEIAGKELARARRTGDAVTVLIVDLDRFKRVNDEYGHLAGDQVLRQVAAALSGQVRGYDLVARFGGEEFAVLLPGTGPTEAMQVADRLRARLARLAVPVTTASGERATVTAITASVGAASHPGHGTELQALILAADEALLRAKRGGRNATRLARTAA